MHHTSGKKMGEKLKQILDFLKSPALTISWVRIEDDDIEAIMKKKKKIEDKREIIDITPK